MGIDKRTRALVYYLSKIQGLSIRQIAKKCNFPRATVWRISKMDLSSKQPSTMAKERRGRPRKLNARLERKLRRSIQILREREGNFTIKRLMENACISTQDISESTISRFLKREGYYYLQARKKGLLKKIDLKNRRIFARKIKNEYPRHVCRTHDIAFYLDGTAFAYKRNPLDQALALKARVWRKRSEGLALGCTAKGRKTLGDEW